MAQPTYTLEELSRKVDAISEFLNEKTDRNLLNLNAVGQGIIDGKVEVEALLEQNGYAKFTWKEGNKVAKLIVQWLKTAKTGYIDLPHVYGNTDYISLVSFAGGSTGSWGNTVGVVSYSTSQCRIIQGHYGDMVSTPFYVATIGY